MIIEKNLLILGFLLLLIFLCTGLAIYFIESLNFLLPDYINGLGGFTGTFGGVISGIVITYIVQHISEKRTRNQLIKNFLFELEMNEDKIKEWLDVVTTYRNSVNGDSFHNFFGYFNLSAFLYFATDKLLLSSDLYTLLTHEELKKLQIVSREMTLGWEQSINNDIAAKREAFVSLRDAGDMSTWHAQMKSEIINHIDFLEKKLRDHLASITSIRTSLDKRM